jgi:hypothetical protein
MNINNLLFQPWVGKEYGNKSKFEIPILIVGESNYTKDIDGCKPHSTFTQRLIDDIIEGRWKHRFFSNIQRTFVENANTRESRSEFWHSVAHHEYIQDWLPAPRVAPDGAMWQKAKPVFQEVLAELKPKCILFVSKRMFDRVQLDFPADIPLTINEAYPPTLKIYNASHTTMKIDNALASWICHPTSHSGGFRRPRGVVSPLIEAAGGKAVKFTTQ